MTDSKHLKGRLDPPVSDICLSVCLFVTKNDHFAQRQFLFLNIVTRTAFELVQQATADLESEQAAHEAWVASLIPPPEAPVTDDEAERAAMINRRRHFMATLMHQPLTEETLAAARAANIFIG